MLASRLSPISVENGVVTPRRPRRPGRLLGLAGAALGLLAAACAGSGFTYVQSSANNAYFKIPDDWELYDKQQVIASTGAKLSEDEESGLRYLAIFDADPKPSLDHDLQTAAHPFGVVRVRRLTVEERDTFSLSALRNEVVPVDEILDKDLGDVDVLSGPESIVKPKGFRGTRLVYTVQSPEGSFTVDQTGLVDSRTTLVYFFIVGCEADCYAGNRKTITEIADSWTIKEP